MTLYCFLGFERLQEPERKGDDDVLQKLCAKPAGVMSWQRRRERFIIIWVFGCRLGEVPPQLRNRSGRAQAKYDSFAVIIPMR